MPVPKEAAFWSVAKLGKQLRAGDFTSVALTEFFIERLKTIGDKLNAVVTVPEELALKQAKLADEGLAGGKDRGPLHGIPYGAKDLLATIGIKTTWGAAPFKDQLIDVDATVITRLRDAGAVLVTKLAMVELAGGFGYRQANASFTGPGLNPWNSNHWSGGSSSGPGSAVGGGLVPFAIGSETWGSIMTPAAFCGISGLRPTYGRVSRYGAMALSWTMDKLGPMCRTADDCGLVLNAIAGADPNDASCVDRPYQYPDKHDKPCRFKVAVLKGSADKVQPEVKANFEKSLEILKEFCEVGETELPEGLPYNSAPSIILSSELAAAFDDFISSGDVWELTAEDDHWGALPCMVIPAKDYINATRVRVHIQMAMDKLLAQYDAILTPTLATVSYPNDQPWREYRRGFSNSDIGGAGNVTGIPAISIPNGFGENHLPTGLQLVGRAFDENRILAIAKRYQELTDWHEETPEV
ncbi:MAG: amidase [Planctomycetaceae bacterium]|nr:amidase [Planctomycetaceae bacterium]